MRSTKIKKTFAVLVYGHISIIWSYYWAKIKSLFFLMIRAYRPEQVPLFFSGTFLKAPIMIIIPDSTQIEPNTRSAHGRGTGRTLTLLIYHYDPRDCLCESVGYIRPISQLYTPVKSRDNYLKIDVLILKIGPETSKLEYFKYMQTSANLRH